MSTLARHDAPRVSEPSTGRQLDSSTRNDLARIRHCSILTADKANVSGQRSSDGGPRDPRTLTRARLP